MEVATKRMVRARRALLGYTAQEEENFEEAMRSPGRYLLVEMNYRGAGYWATRHKSAEDAADYHTGQEYAEDWEPTLLLDLDTGRRFTGEPRVVWLPLDENGRVSA